MPSMKEKLLGLRDKLFSAYETRKLQEQPFAIVTNNCWGYELYNSIRREYNTPFIGLFLFPECYVKFLENFDASINGELTFIEQSRYYDSPKHYPIGRIAQDIEIHFLHYKSNEEALNKWTRRVERLKKEIAEGTELFLKLCDAENCSPEQMKRFHALPFKHKLSLGVKELNSSEHLYVPDLINKKTGVIIDGAKLFKKRYRYFDVTIWILTGKISKSLVSRFFALIP